MRNSASDGGTRGDNTVVLTLFSFRYEERAAPCPTSPAPPNNRIEMVSDHVGDSPGLPPFALQERVRLVVILERLCFGVDVKLAPYAI